MGKGAEPVRAYLGIEEILRIAASAASTPSTRATDSWPRTRSLPTPACARGSCGSARRADDDGAPRQQGRRRGRWPSAAGVPVMPATGARPTTPPTRRAGRGGRLPADGQGELGRRRARDAGGPRRRTNSPRPSRPAGARRGPRSGTTRSSWRGWSSGRGTSRSRSWPTGTATWCTCSSATAPCSAATRRWSRSRPAPRLDAGRARRDLRRRRRRGAGGALPAAGTVEFLMDADTRRFFFIEVNPRIQVEHTVTEVVTGIDIVKAQIRIAQGARIGDAGERRAAARTRSRRNGYALQCRITTEDPENQLHPRLRAHHRLPRRRPASASGSTAARPTPAAVITPVLRLAAGEGHRLGADPRGGGPAHGPGAARVPHPRSEDQPPVPRGAHHPPDVPRRRLHHPLHRRDPRALPLPAAARPRHPAARASSATSS